jgi:hypothetical protein
MVYLKSLRRKIRTFQKFPPAERWLIVQALVLLPLISGLLRLFGMQRTQKALELFVNQSLFKSKSLQQFDAPKIVQLFKVAVRYNINWATCLSQSLVLCWLLKVNNIASELKIGVRSEGGKLEAHSWVECDGVVLNDLPDVSQRFSAFNRSIVEVSI